MHPRSSRSKCAMRWLLLAASSGLALSARVGAQGSPADAARDGAHPPGIWKAVVPPRPMRGQFDDFDPIGIAAGARIKADCSLNWVDPDDGKLYCFSSGTSLEFFLDQPHVNIQRARQGWIKLGAAKLGAATQ